jgi:hypothetical protein
MFSLFKLLPCFLKFSIFSFLFGLAVNCAVLGIICLSLFESVYFWSLVGICAIVLFNLIMQILFYFKLSFSITLLLGVENEQI